MWDDDKCKPMGLHYNFKKYNKKYIKKVYRRTHSAYVGTWPIFFWKFLDRVGRTNRDYKKTRIFFYNGIFHFLERPCVTNTDSVSSTTYFKKDSLKFSKITLLNPLSLVNMMYFIKSMCSQPDIITFLHKYFNWSYDKVVKWFVKLLR